jgi:hypothetical protein
MKKHIIAVVASVVFAASLISSETATAKMKIGGLRPGICAQRLQQIQI